MEIPLTTAAHRRIVREGFVVGATNPKAVVFLAAILPQFAGGTPGPARL